MAYWLLFSLFITLGALGYLGLYLAWRGNRPSASMRDYWEKTDS